MRRTLTHLQSVQRATYEANLARRRYDEVAPSNRLVAAELEARWLLVLGAVDNLLYRLNAPNVLDVALIAGQMLVHDFAEVAFQVGRPTASFLSAPLFSDSAGGLIARQLLPVATALANGLRIAAQHGCDIVDSALPEFFRFNRRMAAAVLLGKGIVKLLHVPTNGATIGVHRVLSSSRPVFATPQNSGKLFLSHSFAASTERGRG